MTTFTPIPTEQQKPLNKKGGYNNMAVVAKKLEKSIDGLRSEMAATSSISQSGFSIDLESLKSMILEMKPDAHVIILPVYNSMSAEEVKEKEKEVKSSIRKRNAEVLTSTISNNEALASVSTSVITMDSLDDTPVNDTYDPTAAFDIK
jgi:DNA-directed RNA polymerase